MKKFIILMISFLLFFCCSSGIPCTCVYEVIRISDGKKIDEIEKSSIICDYYNYSYANDGFCTEATLYYKLKSRSCK